MKKFFSMLLLAPMAIALIACNQTGDEGGTTVLQTKPGLANDNGATDNSGDNTDDDTGIDIGDISMVPDSDGDGCRDGTKKIVTIFPEFSFRCEKIDLTLHATTIPFQEPADEE